MKDALEALRIYKVLADRAQALSIQVPAAHGTLFRLGRPSIDYYQELYVDQARSSTPAQRRPGGELCEYCERFHLGTRKAIDKDKDIVLGNSLEKCFQEFLNEQLNSGGERYICERADVKDYHMPDFRVVRIRDGAALFYFEFKVIFRPFLKIAQFVNSSYECYSHSLTLDLSNGQKLQEQRNRVEQEIGVEKVAYVYWYDLPCVKGVFWMPARQVYDLMDEQDAYDRQKAAGDYDAYGRKRGATRKLYLPLLDMSDLPSMIDHILQQGARESFGSAV